MIEYNQTVKMSRPTPYDLSRFKNLPKDVTMIQYEDLRGMTMKLEAKMNNPGNKGKKFESKLKSENWMYLEQANNISPIALSTDYGFKYYGPIVMGTPN